MVFRVLNIVDDHSRFCPGQIVDVSISAARMARFLDDLALRYGLPEKIVLGRHRVRHRFEHRWRQPRRDQPGDGPAPRMVEVADPVHGIAPTGRHTEYADLLATGNPDAPWLMPEDEWESLALNYTSGSMMPAECALRPTTTASSTRWRSW